VDGFPSDTVVLRQLRVLGAAGREGDTATAQALNLLATSPLPLSEIRSHTLPLQAADEAVRLIGRENPADDPIHVVLVPGSE
jgi:threonine dehydrogenase-like Zn-dependent dehydrogenase